MSKGLGGAKLEFGGEGNGGFPNVCLNAKVLILSCFFCNKSDRIQSFIAVKNRTIVRDVNLTYTAIVLC